MNYGSFLACSSHRALTSLSEGHVLRCCIVLGSGLWTSFFAFSHLIFSAFFCFPISSSFFSCIQYRYQDDDSPPPEHNFPRLTNEVRAPELVHVSEKNLSEIENVHGYVSHSHISPLKVSHPFS